VETPNYIPNHRNLIRQPNYTLFLLCKIIHLHPIYTVMATSESERLWHALASLWHKRGLATVDLILSFKQYTEVLLMVHAFLPVA